MGFCHVSIILNLKILHGKAYRFDFVFPEEHMQRACHVLGALRLQQLFPGKKHVSHGPKS